MRKEEGLGCKDPHQEVFEENENYSIQEAIG